MLRIMITILHLRQQFRIISTTNIASLLIERSALVDEDLHSLLNMAINAKNDLIVKMIVDHGLQDKPSVNLITHFEAAISQGNSKIIEAILLHCGFSKPSDLHIPREFVMDTFSLHENCLEVLLKWYFTVSPDSYHDEDFIYAAFENGHLPIVVDLLEHGIDVNMVNSNTEFNLLTISCLNKHHQIIKKLLEYKADVNVKISSDNEIFYDYPNFDRHIPEFSSLSKLNDHEVDSIDLTCLVIAVFNSDPITVDILLEHGAKIKDNTELFNLTGLAAESGCKEIVQRFLDLGIKVTDVNLHGETLLHFCIYADHDEQDDSCSVAELLLEKGANILLQTRGNNYVSKAVEFNNLKIAQLFLDHHADIQYVSPNGDTLLHKVTKHCSDAEFIKTLLKLNVSVNVSNNAGHTPLLNACSKRSKDQLKIVETLLHHKANLDNRSNCSLTPLMMAIYDENLPIIKILLNHQANLHAEDQEGQTCLHFACKSMCGEIVTIIQLLLEHGADIEAVDVKGRTPLFTALEAGNSEAVECLLNHHANPNHTDLENFTPLHFAIRQASELWHFSDMIYQSVQLLIKHGANIDVLDKERRTPLQYVIENMLGSYAINADPNKCVTYKRYERIVKTLLIQVIKLKTIGIKLENYNSNVDYNSNDYIIIDNRKYSVKNILQLNVDSEFSEVISDNEQSYNEVSIEDIQHLKVQCEQEIKKMKNTNIGTNRFTFYNLFKGDINTLGAIFGNDKIIHLEMGAYEKEFPLYIDIIRNRLREMNIFYQPCIPRISAREYFKSKIGRRLLNQCIDFILNYLNSDDIKTFIEAMKLPSN